MTTQEQLIELKNSTDYSWKSFAKYFGIPYRTMQDWYLGKRSMPEYLLRLMIYKLGIEKMSDMNTETALSVRTGIRDGVLTEICRIAEKHRIRRVLLFGSRARGVFRKDSDIDLAVSGGDAGRFRLDCEEETGTLLGFDVVDLDRSVQPGLLSEIVREGVIIYEKI